MIVPNPKKAATIILSKKHADGTETQTESQNESSDDPFHAIAQDILHAHESKSPHHLASALKAFLAMHSNQSDD